MSRVPGSQVPEAGCRAVAHSNIALAKYWGKRDIARNVPDVPSLSLTLAALSTHTLVRFDPEAGADVVRLGGSPAGSEVARKVIALIDHVRAEAGLGWRVFVDSNNDFPTASGLASSASGFAALALAALGAAGLSWPSPAVSALARAASVSAARSVYGGFVALEAGALEAQPLEAAPKAAGLRMVVAITQTGPKKVGSTQGMLLTQRTSPLYPGWRDAAPRIYAELRGALQAGDFEKVGEAMEHSTLCMHGSMFAARPGLIYATGATLAAIDCVRELRAAGTFAYFTMDAGPHVKVLTLEPAADAVRRALETVPGVLQVLVSGAGGPARLMDEVSRS
ncbi:MAG TPA: diphosphomevalonate decarboxylase [Polyangiaceae bacterium]|jgi:diphosphomevalonate decarboxylase|nr:diphosphomevalonate decarboxylase [Polyangiaceae bacterium]